MGLSVEPLSRLWALLSKPEILIRFAVNGDRHQIFSRARMKFSVNVTQPVSRHVRINFGRADICVAEQFLDHAQIRAMLQQVRGETVPQHVGCHIA